MKIEVLRELGDCPRTLHLLTRLWAESSPREPRSPVNLALAIDRSSSMRGPRMAQALLAARELLSRLGPKDRLSIVTFDAAPQILCPPTPVTDENRSELGARLDDLDTGVGTNLAAGIRAGADLIRSSFVRGAIPRLVLLTDGQPSVGITDASKLWTLAEIECERGVSITAMGLGEGFDDELMAEIAKRGGGAYYYLAAAADIPAAFGRELDGVFAIAARKTQLKLLPHDDFESVELLHRLPCRSLDDGILVDVGDVAADAPRQLLFKLTRCPDATGKHAATITTTHRTPSGEAGDPHIVGVDLPSAEATRERNAVVDERLRLRVASAVDAAWARRSSGRSGTALLTLREVRAEVAGEQSRRDQDSPFLSELLEDLEAAEHAIANSAAERERVRRTLREKSQVSMLGRPVFQSLSRDDDDH